MNENLWAEAISHVNLLLNRLPSSRLSGNIPINIWNPNVTFSFSKIPFFGQHGYSFIYIPSTRANKKLLTRSSHSRFLGMQSDERLCRVQVTETGQVVVVRLADFRPSKQKDLPGVQSLLDGLSRKAAESEIYTIEGNNNEDA